ncbi:MAG: AbrB/MazE/SpoVT family DNA-binding domain-containing protein [Acidimicrobiia bacterium]
MELMAQVSGRGTITLPSEIRRALGLREGDVLTVSVQDGRIVLAPAVLTPVELYTEERQQEFAANAEMSPAELTAARQRWKQSTRRR